MINFLIFSFAIKRAIFTKQYFITCEKLRTLWGLFIAYIRGGSRAAATSKMERFVIIVNG